jgi:Tol biopolymer transport system component
MPLAEVNTPELERWMSICDDGHYVVVRAIVSLNMGEDLYEGTLGGGAPAPIAELNTPGFDSGAFLTADCLTLYFASDRDNGQRDIFVSHRATVDAPWQPPQPFAPFNDPLALDEDPWMSPDGHTFMFSSDRDGRQRDIYISTR